MFFMRFRNIKKILVVNPYGIGDSLFITPIIRTLKKVYPDVRLSVLIGSRTKEVFHLNPDVDQLFEHNKDYFRSLTIPSRFSAYLRLCRVLRKQKFDLMLDFSNTDEYAFFAKFFWKIPLRLGFQYKNRGRFLNLRVEKSRSNPFTKKTHIVEHYYEILKPLNIDPSYFEKKLFFYPDPKEKRWLDALFQKYSVSPSDAMIILIPAGGASWGMNANQKHWPVKHFSDLIKKLHSLPNLKIFLVGGDTEKGICSELAKDLRCIDLCGQTHLHQLATLMRASQLVIGNESGPLHLATALDCKAILLYGPVSEITYGPFTNSPALEEGAISPFSLTSRQIPLFHNTPCRPCYHNYRAPQCENRICLNELMPETVYQCTLALLRNHLYHS